MSNKKPQQRWLFDYFYIFIVNDQISTKPPLNPLKRSLNLESSQSRQRNHQQDCNSLSKVHKHIHTHTHTHTHRSMTSKIYCEITDIDRMNNEHNGNESYAIEEAAYIVPNDSIQVKSKPFF